MDRSEAGKLGYQASKLTQEEAFALRVSIYNEKPRLCKHCLIPLSYEDRLKSFCTRSCAASHNNVGKNRWKKKPGRFARNKPCVVCGNLCQGRNKFCPSCIQEGRHLRRPNSLEGLKSDTARRRYLLRTRPYECAICSIVEWRGEPAPLEMDHIDGDPYNNTEENLRLLCVMCHAQQPTSKGHNRGNGRWGRRLRYDQGKSF